MIYTVKVTGQWVDLEKLLDCAKPSSYLVKRTASSISVFLESPPAYQNLYESILRFQSGRFRDPDTE